MAAANTLAVKSCGEGAVHSSNAGDSMAMEDIVLSSVEDGSMTGKAGGKIGWDTKGHHACVWDGGGLLELLPKLQLTHGDDGPSDRQGEESFRGIFDCRVVDDGSRGLLEAGVPASSKSCSECQT